MSNPLPSNALAAHRKQHGLSQAQAARLAGCSDRRELARYERGTRLPSLPRAARLASAYRASVEALFPDLFTEARSDTDRRRLLKRLRPTHHYEPKPGFITVLAIYPATRKVGVAVFEVPAPAQGPPIPPADQTSAKRRRQTRRTAGARSV